MTAHSTSDRETFTSMSLDADNNISVSIQQLFVHSNKGPGFIDVVYNATNPLLSSHQFTQQSAPDAIFFAPLRQFSGRQNDHAHQDKIDHPPEKTDLQSWKRDLC